MRLRGVLLAVERCRRPHEIGKGNKTWIPKLEMDKTEFICLVMAVESIYSVINHEVALAK